MCVQQKAKQLLSDAKRQLKKENMLKQKEINSDKKYFVKNSEVKKAYLADKFKVLEKNGMLETTMAKLNKRQATKERKLMFSIK